MNDFKLVDLIALSTLSLAVWQVVDIIFWLFEHVSVTVK